MDFGIKNSEFVFARIVVRDDFFGVGSIHYLVVRNAPEKDGKFGGYGMPGGGVVLEDDLSLHDSLRLEIWSETGLGTGLVYLDDGTTFYPEDGEVAVSDAPYYSWGGKCAIRYPNKRIRYVDSTDGDDVPQEVREALSAGLSVSIPVTYVFDANVAWDGSALQAVFRAAAPTRQDERGIFVGATEIREILKKHRNRIAMFLPSEMANGEIDGLALVTPAYISALMDYDFRKQVSGSEAWYYTHLKALSVTSG